MLLMGSSMVFSEAGRTGTSQVKIGCNLMKLGISSVQLGTSIIANLFFSGKIRVFITYLDGWKFQRGRSLWNKITVLRFS